ncbi:MAG TPA: STM4012 family radical SAM protein [Tepidisphaeraceae bacterium]|nr:STM4012 family radical SAM protein [Tepidisphaeraceae bacterium]
MSGRSVTLEQARAGTPYAAYSYAYPHKTAYRRLDPPRPLGEVWAGEDRSALYFYLHVPFCEMRCGFCNLFTTANANDARVERYLAALERQARAVRAAVGPASFARAAIGGGTPTYLSARDLERVLRLARDVFGLDPRRTPTSVETSPRTADADKLGVLREHGVERISIGVQSLVDAEVAAAGRAQKVAWVDAAVGRIRAAGFPTLNLDLIYGLPGQTVDSWARSLAAALEYRPEELYLYPLYVRPLTGLDRRAARAEDQLRVECYRAGRDLLAAAGYEQLSMRMFRSRSAPDAGGPVYCCQDDGMLGLGCGARSYTESLHYSSEYAVGAAGVTEILDSFAARSADAFAHADYGCELNADERRRRWVVKSLLRMPGLCAEAYRAEFGTDVAGDFPELRLLADEGWTEAAAGASVTRLTPAGLERSDAIGPLFYSAAMTRLSDEYELE